MLLLSIIFSQNPPPPPISTGYYHEQSTFPLSLPALMLLVHQFPLSPLTSFSLLVFLPNVCLNNIQKGWMLSLLYIAWCGLRQVTLICLFRKKMMQQPNQLLIVRTGQSKWNLHCHRSNCWSFLCKRIYFSFISMICLTLFIDLFIHSIIDSFFQFCIKHDICTFIWSLIHSITNSCLHSFNWFIYLSLIHSIIVSIVFTFIWSLIHSFNHFYLFIHIQLIHLLIIHSFNH